MRHTRVPTWADGTAALYTNWDSEYPPTYVIGHTYCVSMTEDGLMHIKDCESTTLPSICQADPGKYITDT